MAKHDVRGSSCTLHMDGDSIDVQVHAHTANLGGHYLTIQAGAHSFTLHAPLSVIQSIHAQLGQCLQDIDSFERAVSPAPEGKPEF